MMRLSLPASGLTGRGLFQERNSKKFSKFGIAINKVCFLAKGQETYREMPFTFSVSFIGLSVRLTKRKWRYVPCRCD